jgi:hypothetical protein
MPRSLLTNAIALLEFETAISRLIGPETGGLTLTMAGPGVASAGISALFLAASLLAARMQTPAQEHVAGKSPWTALLALGELIGFAWRSATMRWLVLTTLIFSMLVQSAVGGSFKGWVDDMGGGTTAFMVLGLGLFGGVAAGPLLLAAFNPSRRMTLVLVRLLLLGGALMVVSSLFAMFGLLSLAIVLQLLTSMVAVAFVIVQTSATLAATPPSMRGRVSALMGGALLLPEVVAGGMLSLALGEGARCRCSASRLWWPRRCWRGGFRVFGRCASALEDPGLSGPGSFS